jgi:hypothetical protein
MHDVNPLGQIMHLRELDRQAAPQLRPLRLERKGMPMLTTFRAKMTAVLRRFTRWHILASGQTSWNDFGFDRHHERKQEL